MPLITLKDAYKKKYEKIFFTWPNYGDNLCFLFACQKLFEQTQQPVLIGTNREELFEHVEFVDILPGYSYLNMREPVERYENVEALKKIHIKPIFLAYGKNNVPASFNYNHGTMRIWEEEHILATYCRKMGVKGTITLAPEFPLAEEEKKFGRFFSERQVAIMTDGTMEYKNWGTEKFQAIVNRLKDEYSFVQIGSNIDRRLKNTLDCLHFSYKEAASILYNSDMFVGNIGAQMHLARAVGCPSVIAYSRAEPSVFDSYPCNANVSAENSCSLCGEGKRSVQQVCPENFSCIKNISVEDMIQAIRTMKKTCPMQAETVTIEGIEAAGLEEFYQVEDWVFESIVPTQNCDICLFGKILLFSASKSKDKLRISFLGFEIFRKVITQTKIKFFIFRYIPLLFLVKS